MNARKVGKIDTQVATQHKQEKTCKKEASQKAMHKVCKLGEEDWAEKKIELALK